MTTAAKSGDKVAVHYTGKRSDGTVFDSSRERDPIRFVLGGGEVIPGFEKAIMGMTQGQTKRALVHATDAYGVHRPEMVADFSWDKMPPDMDVRVGQELTVRTDSGQTLNARVVETTTETVTVDANHPLAGEDVTFEIELVEVAPA